MRKDRSVIVILLAAAAFYAVARASSPWGHGQDGRATSRRGDQQLLDAYYQDYNTRVERHIYRKTPQGELAIHIHFPKDWAAQDKHPAIVFFFGGGWTGGTIEQFTRQAHYLASRGMVAARADYRVRSRHQTTPEVCVEDAKSAVRWLRKNAAKFGIDPDRIVASGGSAGGHIAACTSTVTGLDAEGEDTGISCRPNLLILYNPVLNCADEQIALRMGSTDMANRLSPNLHLSKDMQPAIVFYGTEDRFYSQGKEFLQLSKELGNKVELYAAGGQPHGFFNRSPWHQQTTFLVDKFLARHGYLAGEPALKLGEKDITLKRIAAEQKEGERPSPPPKRLRPPRRRKPRDNEPGLKVGQLAPDFKLPPLVIQTGADGQSVGIIESVGYAGFCIPTRARLPVCTAYPTIVKTSFRGKKPVCLIFSPDQVGDLRFGPRPGPWKTCTCRTRTKFSFSWCTSPRPIRTA
jgi:acetyl esterase/lipase